MSFQKVVKPLRHLVDLYSSFRTVSFQKVVKQRICNRNERSSFRTVSFQKVVKLVKEKGFVEEVLELCHFRR